MESNDILAGISHTMNITDKGLTYFALQTHYHELNPIVNFLILFFGLTTGIIIALLVGGISIWFAHKKGGTIALSIILGIYTLVVALNILALI